MKQKKGLTTFAVLVLVYLNVGAEAQKPTSCPAIANPDVTILLPHRTDCTKFYSCVHGKEVEFDCPDGLHFSVEDDRCEWPYIAECDSIGVIPPTIKPPPGPSRCPPVADPNVTILLPHESDCTKFYYCVHGEEVEFDCPDDLHWSIKENRCEWPDIAECDPSAVVPPGTIKPPPGTSRCPPVADPNVTILLPHESDCTKFYYCVHGEEVEFDCPDDLHWSIKENRCEWPDIAECDSSAVVPPGTIKPTPGTSRCPPVADPNVTILLPHESDCTKFYYCVHGEEVEFDCPDDLHWSIKENRCEWPDIAECDPSAVVPPGTIKPPPGTSRCPPVADPNVTILLPHENDCTKFYYCVHGEEVEFDCPDDLHWSIKENRCEWPDIAECDLSAVVPPPVLPPVCPATHTSNDPIHLPHANCHKFYKCDHGVPVEFDCPSGLHWSIADDRCEYSKEPNCLDIELN